MPAAEILKETTVRGPTLPRRPRPARRPSTRGRHPRPRPGRVPAHQVRLHRCACRAWRGGAHKDEGRTRMENGNAQQLLRMRTARGRGDTARALCFDHPVGRSILGDPPPLWGAGQEREGEPQPHMSLWGTCVTRPRLLSRRMARTACPALVVVTRKGTGCSAGRGPPRSSRHCGLVPCAFKYGISHAPAV